MLPIKTEDLETPALLVDMDILESNIGMLANFMSDKPAKLRPHYKTFKCPALAHKLIDAGAKGITCSKLSEAETLVQAGIKDVLIANQIVEPTKMYRLMGLAKSNSKITVAVDDLANVDDLCVAASNTAATLYCLVEVDVGMHRCGVQTADEVLALAKKISQSKGLVFEGLQAYEGNLILTKEVAPRKKGVEAMIEKITGIKRLLEQNNLPVKEISGGGSSTYFLTGDNTIWTEIQAGTYVFMDDAYSKIDGLPFKKSLTVLSTIMHKRRGMAVADMGLKTCTTELGQPSIKSLPHIQLFEGLNEEHAIICDVKDELTYKQKIEFYPSHCCTTVNLHDTFYCVRNGLVETTWPITGRGKSQ